MSAIPVFESKIIFKIPFIGALLLPILCGCKLVHPIFKMHKSQEHVSALADLKQPNFQLGERNAEQTLECALSLAPFLSAAFALPGSVQAAQKFAIVSLYNVSDTLPEQVALVMGDDGRSFTVYGADEARTFSLGPAATTATFSSRSEPKSLQTEVEVLNRRNQLVRQVFVFSEEPESSFRAGQLKFDFTRSPRSSDISSTSLSQSKLVSKDFFSELKESGQESAWSRLSTLVETAGLNALKVLSKEKTSAMLVADAQNAIEQCVKILTKDSSLRVQNFLSQREIELERMKAEVWQKTLRAERNPETRLSFKMQSMPGGREGEDGRNAQYFKDENERRQFEVFIDKKNVRYLDGEELEGHFIFVMGKDGRVFASRDRTPRAHVRSDKMMYHSSFLAGDDVAAAGEFWVQKGIITKVNEESGHYRPPPELNRQFLDRLQELGHLNVIRYIPFR